MSVYPKHNEDIYGWAIHTAELLRNERMTEVDFQNIIEEMEALGRSEQYELMNRLSLVLSHLLKWQYQPNLRSHSWICTIREQRKQTKIHLKNNPSLKSKLNDIVENAYELAIVKASRETSLSEEIFPTLCPYNFEQIMDNDFYPTLQ